MGLDRQLCIENSEFESDSWSSSSSSIGLHTDWEVQKKKQDERDARDLAARKAGITEQDAVRARDRAIRELGLDRDEDEISLASLTYVTEHIPPAFEKDLDAKEHVLFGKLTGAQHGVYHEEVSTKDVREETYAPLHEHHKKHGHGDMVGAAMGAWSSVVTKEFVPSGGSALGVAGPAQPSQVK